MATNNSAAIRFAPKGRIFVAPVGTELPEDVATTLPATWKELGYCSPDGVELMI